MSYITFNIKTLLLAGVLSLSAMAYDNDPAAQSSGEQSGKQQKSLKKRDVAKFIPRMATAPLRGAAKGAKGYLTDESLDWSLGGDGTGKRPGVKGFAKGVIRGAAGGPGSELKRYKNKYKAYKQSKASKKAQAPFSEY